MLEQLGIEMVTIPLPFRLNHVNCFIAEGEKGHILIDTGLNDQAAKLKWEEILQGKKVGQILITHLHPDHSGYAGTLQRKTNAEVLMTKTDATALEQVWEEASIPPLLADYKRADVPTQLAEGIVTVTEKFRPYVFPEPRVNHFLDEGEQIQIGALSYEVIFTPGHAEGLICLYNKEKNVLMSTDHILPKITPNIAYWFYGEANPLLSYEHSLQKIKQLNADYVIPSHGKPFYDANKRIDEIWRHHEDRFVETLDAIKGGATIFSVCEKLFTNDLNVYDYQFAIGETIAHLEYLREKGACKREMHKGKWIYT